MHQNERPNQSLRPRGKVILEKSIDGLISVDLVASFEVILFDCLNAIKLVAVLLHA
jgi:hypothetical protein